MPTEYEEERLHFFRQLALEKAVQSHTPRTVDDTDDAIVRTAEAFWEFLKGNENN